MLKIIICQLLTLTILSLSSFAQDRGKVVTNINSNIDTLSAKNKIERYLSTIRLNPNDTIIKLVNKIIPKEDKKLGAFIAATTFNYFHNSDIMGQEAVAVKIAEDYFLNKKLEWPNKDGLFMLRTFVELNKHSLIGMKAPELALTDTSGMPTSLNDTYLDYTILYFYTDDCITCKIETPKLVDFINEYKNGPLTVYAIYTHDNTTKWKEYINKEFNIYNPFVNWINVYDPEFESGFHMLYNVISTPQMFLLDREKRIIGRNLKTDSLTELLAAKQREKEQTHSFFNKFFSNIAGDTTAVYMGIDALYQKSKDDTTLLKSIFRELYDFSRMSPDNNLQKGGVYLGEKYIIGKEELWEMQFVEEVRHAIMVFNMNPLGADAADLSLKTPKGEKIKLSEIKNEYKVLYFYASDCGLCTEVSPKMKELYETYKKQIDVEFIAIDVRNNRKEWLKYIKDNGFTWLDVCGEKSAEEIYNNYFLENIPAIYILKGNMVIAKDINDLDVKEVMEMIKEYQNNKTIQ